MDRVVRTAPADALGYGDPRGRIELRTILAAYLGRVRGVRVDPSHLVICSGYTQALQLLTQVFAGLGAKTAAIENPALADHVAVVRSRLKVLDVPVDRGGMVTELIGDSAQVAICTPAHQFPLGVSMSPPRRARLLSAARANGTWIVEDDYDGEFRYDREPISALQSKDPAAVVYVGSTSKSLGPAVRLGWIACPSALLEPLIEAKRLADRQTSPLDQLALAELIESGGYDRHLRGSRLAYRRRRDELRKAVDTRLPGATLIGIAAGLHAVLVPPPQSGSEPELVSRLRSRSIQVHGLSDYLRGQPPRRPGLVIGYATPPEHGYVWAVTALLDALTESTHASESS
jgi:GntR family transcriptional regulator / MocR family aminotransferase